MTVLKFPISHSAVSVSKPAWADAEQLTGPAFGRRGPVTLCNALCHAPVTADRENCPGQHLPENCEADDGENLSLRLGNCDYYRCSPDCKGHQIDLRSVSIGKWFNIISFLIANWTTVLIYLDNLSAFRQNVCDGMIWWHIFVEKVNENFVNQSFFARDVYIIRGPKIRSRGK